jgi:hypothetical protein
MVFTDKLASYRMAHRRMIPGTQHRRSKHLNKMDGKTPTTDPSARTTGGDVQRSRPSAAILIRTRRNITTLSTTPSSPPRHAYHREMANRFST